MARIPVGRSFGPYRIDDVLGTGATGTVYRARKGDGSTIAVKLLSPIAMGNAEMRRAIHREFWAMKRLDHPNIPAVHRMGTIADVLYIEMELVDGPTIASRLEGRAKLDPSDLVRVGASVARTLAHCHDRRVIHRDVKPTNLLVDADESVKLFDFGLALDLDDPDAEPGRVYGTPGYLSPEQVLAERSIDGRADLYSLGATMFRLATGTPPFVGERLDLLRAHVEDEPPRPSVATAIPADVESVILRAMAKDPDDRFQTGDEMALTLETADMNELIEPDRRGLFRKRS